MWNIGLYENGRGSGVVLHISLLHQRPAVRASSLSNRLAQMTVSTQNATPPKSTKSKNWDSTVSRRTNSHWDFDLVWICTEEFESLYLVDFGVVALWVERVICNTGLAHMLWLLSFVVAAKRLGAAAPSLFATYWVRSSMPLPCTRPRHVSYLKW